jgi:hypothetical protein
MMEKDISTDELLKMYRHVKGLLPLVEQALMTRGIINCPKCGVRHQPTERHVFGAGISSITPVSG